MRVNEVALQGTSRKLFPSEEDHEGGAFVTIVKQPTDVRTSSNPSTTLKNQCDVSREPLSSPSDVSAHPMLAQDASLHSTIIMGEDGAEVALGMSSLSLGDANLEQKTSTPQTRPSRARVLQEVRSNSLIDAIDMTPKKESPKHHRRHHSNPLAGCWQCETAHQVSPQGQDETEISRLLEDSQAGTGCNGWQAWSYFDMLGDEETETIGSVQKDIRSQLRNRAYNLDARKSRMQNLRKNLSPFALSPKRKSAADLFPSRSFSITEHASAIVRVSKQKRQLKGLSHILKSCTSPSGAMVDSPMMKRFPNIDEDDVFYDSDPEEFARPQCSPDRLDNANKENIQDYESYSYPRSISSSPTGTIADVNNDAAYGAVVQEFLNETITLILHPSRQSTANSVSNAQPVKAWVERGQRLNPVIQPKFKWKSVCRNKTKGSSFVVPTVTSIELLDITRILKVDRIDRKRYPFAKPLHCFSIRALNQEELFFEAKSFAERNRIVYSLKLVVSRFGSKVIVADGTLFKEFFVTSDSVVPGDAPNWTNGRDLELSEDC